jgi:hypothetical protein
LGGTTWITPRPKGAGFFVCEKEVIEMTDEEAGTAGTYESIFYSITFHKEEANV